MPISWLYSAISKLRKSITKPIKVSVPVICIGNITVGGSGKTPVAIEIAKNIDDWIPAFAGMTKGKVHFLTRGYGGSIKTPTLVDIDKHTASEVGDEPLLLAKIAPTWVSKDRIAGALEAIKNGAEIIIMDDGLQNPTIHKDFKILVIDGEYGLGNERIFPAGPLREKKCDVDIVIQIGNLSKKPFFPNISTVNAKIIPEKIDVKKVVAFAGIGRPEKFFKTLESLGVKIMKKIEFPDHYPYTKQDIEKLQQTAKSLDAELITTEKDFVRLSVKEGIKTLPITVEFENIAFVTVINKLCVK